MVNKELVLKLYKARVPGKEAALMLGCSYSRVQMFYKIFGLIQIPQLTTDEILSAVEAQGLLVSADDVDTEEAACSN